MPEEVSPESKLYVKEEIEKTRKEFKEDIKEVQSKTTRTFATVALVVGLLTGLSIYGSVTSYISTTIRNRLGAQALADFEKRLYRAQEFVADANVLRDKIATYETEANAILSSQYYATIIGTIVPYGGKIESTSEDPCQVKPGWFFCNGASLNRKEYEELFKVIGVAFGSPTRDTFNLPDLRGRVTVGAGSGKGLTPRELGKTGGEETHKLTIDEMPKHRHRWKDVRNDRRDDYGFGGSERNVHFESGKYIDNICQDQGNDKSHNNMQPFLVVNYIIRAR